MSPGAPFVRESGSAYLLALLVLTTLTGLGIVVSRVASMERRLGSSVVARAQAMGSAESGLAVAETRLVEGDRSDAFEFVFGRTVTAGGVIAGNRTIVEGVLPVALAPCNLCEVGRGSPFFKVDYAAVATGERRVWSQGRTAATGRLLASFSIEATLTVQPWPLADGVVPEQAPPEVSW